MGDGYGEEVGADHDGATQGSEAWADGMFGSGTGLSEATDKFVSVAVVYSGIDLGRCVGVGIEYNWDV